MGILTADFIADEFTCAHAHGPSVMDLAGYDAEHALADIIEATPITMTQILEFSGKMTDETPTKRKLASMWVRTCTLDLYARLVCTCAICEFMDSV
jgi:hypothetical protein